MPQPTLLGPLQPLAWMVTGQIGIRGTEDRKILVQIRPGPKVHQSSHDHHRFKGQKINSKCSFCD